MHTYFNCGKAKEGAKLFMGEFYQVEFCRKCEKTYKEELAEMYEGKLDDY